MPDMISDGRGKGNLAEVNSEQQLLTFATTTPLIAKRSEFDGNAFGITTPMRTITTTGGRILFIKNLDSSKNFYFTDFWFNWNGGNTNHNRAMLGQLVFNDTVPDTNVTTGSAGATNRTIPSSADLTVLYWDETGDGMTGHTPGTAGFYWCNGQGAQHYHVGGAIIIGTNDTISVNLQGEEEGEAAINILGFLK